MSRENMLIKINPMPNIDVNLKSIDSTDSEGIIIKEWSSWSDHLECNLQYADVLVDAQVIRYWKPVMAQEEDFLDGFWEIAGQRKGSYTMTPIQSHSAG